MRVVREKTIKILDLIDQGVLSWELVGPECLAYMSEDQVAQMSVHFLDCFDTEED